MLLDVLLSPFKQAQAHHKLPVLFPVAGRALAEKWRLEDGNRDLFSAVGACLPSQLLAMLPF